MTFPENGRTTGWIRSALGPPTLAQVAWHHPPTTLDGTPCQNHLQAPDAPIPTSRRPYHPPPHSGPRNSPIWDLFFSPGPSHVSLTWRGPARHFSGRSLQVLDPHHYRQHHHHHHHHHHHLTSSASIHIAVLDALYRKISFGNIFIQYGHIYTYG
jgi:hypothetical protein